MKEYTNENDGIGMRGRPPSLRRRGVQGVRLAIPLLALSTVTACAGDGWVSPDYQPGPSEPPAEEGTVQGLTVLVSFQDVAIGDVQAVKLFRAMNESGYTDDGNAGSVKDYFQDMSGGELTVESRVVRVQVDEVKSAYDRNEDDEFYAPPGLTSIDAVTVQGPSTDLLADVLCKLRTCNGTPPEYQEVTASGVSATVHVDLDFSSLTTRRLAFWPDEYVRDFVGSSDLSDPGLRKYVDVPDLTIYDFVNLIYAGHTSQTKHGHGLWPRSVPSIGTVVPGSTSGVRLGRFQLQGTRSTAANPEETFTGTLIHETAHTLFDLPDLYDSGDELGLELGSSRPISQGVGAHALMGSTASEKKAPILSAPLKDRLGWANVIDIADVEEGTTITLQTNGAQIARYCRPDSAFDECYYIEARSKAHPRGPSGFAPESPDEGLVVWHSENSRSVLDFVVNNHPEGTANLHYEVALVQADGDRELEGPRGTGSQSDDYFKAGYADRFDALTAPSSHWWDGSESGLSIRNISAVGATMSFEIGRRPVSRIYVDADAHVQVDAGPATLQVGEKRTVTVTPDAGFAFDVVGVGHESFEVTGLTSPQTFEVTGSLRDNHLRVTSYPVEQGPPAPSAYRELKFMVAAGAQVTAFAEDSRTYAPRSRTFDVFDGFATFRPGQEAYRFSHWDGHPYDLLFRTYEGRESIRIFAKAEPGFVLRNLDVYGLSFDGVGLHDAAYRKSASGVVAVPPDHTWARQSAALVNAEPIPGYFCRDGAVEQWRPDRIYRDVGDKVRYGDYVYSSNVPRNFLRGNVDADGRPVATPTSNPENSPAYWTRFVSCKAYTEDCSGVPEWSLGGNASQFNPATAGWGNQHFAVGDRAEFNGAVYELVGNRRNEVPGAFEYKQVLGGADVYALLNKNAPIYSNRPFVYKAQASWKLVGNCSTPENWQRATIVPSQGVVGITPNGLTHVQHHVTEPAFVTGIAGSWSFDFDVEPGYALEDVYLDGQPLGLLSAARTVAIPFIPHARPPYIEVKTACTGAVCGAAAPASVECELGPVQEWGIGFVYPSVKVTNVSGAPITGWQVLLEFAGAPDLWNSSGITYQVDGNQVVASNTYEWNGNLAPGASYNFSVGGNLSGSFVPPTCTGL